MMGLQCPRLTCDECGREFDVSEYREEDNTAAAIGRMARREGWLRADNGWFCKACIDKATRPEARP